MPVLLWCAVCLAVARPTTVKVEEQNGRVLIAGTVAQKDVGAHLAPLSDAAAAHGVLQLKLMKHLPPPRHLDPRQI